jgi:RNAse (barnase) inhibitor barstar
MSGGGFWDIEEPFVQVAEARSHVLLSSAFDRTGKLFSARFDGVSLENDDIVYLQFYTAFAFPEYFGWNWDALSDCLRDLSWCPADRYVVLIDRAERILEQDREGRRVLLSILKRAAREWADPAISLRAESVPFKVILLCDKEYVERMREEVRVS